MNVVVVGAGAGGLAAALALSREGHAVTLLERDATPVPEHFEDAFSWPRRGAPQFHHSHVFLPGLRKVLKDRYPDVLAELGGHGVRESSLAPWMGLDPGEPAAADLLAIPCRRTTYEWVLRRVVTGSVRMETGTVTGVLADPSRRGPPHVTHVLVKGADPVPADLVVACTGRRGDVPAWLAGLGIAVAEQTQESPATYATRFYRLRPGTAAMGGTYRLGRKDGLGYGFFPADNDTHSVSLFVRPEDHELRRHVLDQDRFDAACAGINELAPYVDPGAVEPITPVQPMAGLINRLRTFTDDRGDPLVTGFVALGDAYMATNPTYGRGCTVAMIQAAALADAVRDHAGDATALAVSYEAAAARDVVPWYYLSVVADQLSAASDRGGDFSLTSSLAAEAPEISARLAFARVFTLLDPPANLAADPALVRMLTQPLRRGSSAA